MKELILKYLEAWETKNLDQALSTLHKNFKGIRTFFEEIIFDQYGLDAAIDNPIDLKYTINKELYYETYATIDATMKLGERTHEVTFKIIFLDDMIYQVYETQKLIGKKRIKCLIAYDGSMYNGYQIQDDEITVQGAIQKALKEALNEDITIHGSGRTDKGVHANNQIIHFDTSTNIPGENIKKVVNKYLPDTIHMKESEEAHETFHSRYDILSKQYVYHLNLKEYNVIQKDYEWYPGDFDIARFKEEILSIIGRHDFTALTKTLKNSNFRVIQDVTFVESDTHLKVFIKGNGFLRYMVRNIVGYAMSISQGKTDSTLLKIIESLDNSLVKDIAPASGLYMNEVIYSE